jgi:hypothetical protein
MDRRPLSRRRLALEQLLKHVSREGKEIFTTGANLHIVNGLGSTDCADEEFEPTPDYPNGLGNLIVGYNELRGFEDVRIGLHHVVVGQRHNFSRFSGLVVGDDHEISGGFNWTAAGQFDWVAGTLVEDV